MNSLGIVILLLLIIVICSAARQWALLGTIAGVLYLTQAQAINLGGFNLYAFRIIELAAFARVILRRELLVVKYSKIDKIFYIFLVFSTVVYALRTREHLSNQVGVAVDAYLSYSAFRGLIHNSDDLRRFLRLFLIVLIPYAAITVYERLTEHNLFGIIGGRVLSESTMRNGHIRACGSFRHPSLLGTLGGTFLPLYIAVALDRKLRIFGALGLISCLGIVWASNSGGPATCVMITLVGWLCWLIRAHMQLFRQGVLSVIAGLALVMRAPIWYLPDRLSAITGGGGYHRSRLMDQAIAHVDQWWLAGMAIEDTFDWFPYYIEKLGGADITNQFLSYGIAAGIGSLLLFIYLLVQICRLLGSALNAVRAYNKNSQIDEYLLWGLGVMVIVHVFNWIGVTYFDQSYAIWYLQFASIVGASVSFQSATLQVVLPPYARRINDNL